MFALHRRFTGDEKANAVCSRLQPRGGVACTLWHVTLNECLQRAQRHSLCDEFRPARRELLQMRVKRCCLALSYQRLQLRLQHCAIYGQHSAQSRARATCMAVALFPCLLILSGCMILAASCYGYSARPACAIAQRTNARNVCALWLAVHARYINGTA
jgi:hypothetical protein